MRRAIRPVDADAKSHELYLRKPRDRVPCTSLIAAADRCGHALTKAACERISPQEQAMARWLLEQVPAIFDGLFPALHLGR
ncbi:DUF892 family protein [Caballeronia sp. LZ065]|uniref:DUF892 family protein n=1 Tax=Caballeronia sp. LZ065 TaxID=3038571 RepID=UPI0038574328